MKSQYIENISTLTDEKINMLIKIEASLVSTPLIGLYRKIGEDYLIAVLPNPKKQAKELTIAEICSQVADIPGVSIDKKAVEDSVRSILPESSEINFKINELYYLKEKKGEELSTDYAFEISMLTKDFSAIGIDIESASLAIWNTEKKSELERMGIDDILALLE